MILSIGEILVDIYEAADTKLVLPGGAPFNLACNIAHFKGDVCFYGAVGKDDYGDMLKQFAEQRPFKRIFIKQWPDKETTQAIVSLKDGERCFTFKRKNGADYLLSMSDVKQFTVNSDTIIHLGSLLLSTSEGRQFVDELLAYVSVNQSTLSFDFNYREDIFGDFTTMKTSFESVVKRANIIKFSEEELLLFTGKSNMNEALDTFGHSDQLIIITLGERGSAYYLQGVRHNISTIHIRPIDTTGAGDAFFSYILYALDHKNYLELSHKALERIFYKANIVGARATLKKGAIDVVPTIDEIERVCNEQE